LSGRPPESEIESGVLAQAFFDRPVLDVARDLVGCTFLSHGVGGRIVETEAYDPGDRSSHSFRGRTARNAVMFGPPGRLYVYFTYGMHFCSNIVCEAEGVGAAVLLRALEPTFGVEQMALRRGTREPRRLCSGPARLTQALAIGREANGLAVWDAPLAVLPRGAGEVAGHVARPAPAPRIVATPRIGVGENPLPWRFIDADSLFLSRPLPRGARP
jgi:DNA-3-methyladenine glycosylase